MAVVARTWVEKWSLALPVTLAWPVTRILHVTLGMHDKIGCRSHYEWLPTLHIPFATPNHTYTLTAMTKENEDPQLPRIVRVKFPHRFAVQCGWSPLPCVPLSQDLAFHDNRTVTNHIVYHLSGFVFLVLPLYPKTSTHNLDPTTGQRF